MCSLLFLAKVRAEKMSVSLTFTPPAFFLLLFFLEGKEKEIGFHKITLSSLASLINSISDGLDGKVFLWLGLASLHITYKRCCCICSASHLIFHLT